MTDCCVHGYETSGSIKCRKFLERLSGSDGGLCCVELLISLFAVVFTSSRLFYVSLFVRAHATRRDILIQ